MESRALKMLETRLATFTPYAIKVKVTRRKSLGLYITPKNGVELRIPKSCSAADAIAFVQTHQSWLDTHVAQIQAQTQALALKHKVFWQEGSEHYVLGNVCSLKLVPIVQKSAWEESGLSSPMGLQEPVIYLPIFGSSKAAGAKTDADNVKASMAEYYREVLRQLMPELLTPILDKLYKAYKPRSPYQSFSLRKMRKRWGSCNSQGRLSFNLWLARFPTEIIEFVISHEVAHLVVLNHSAEFYQCLDYLLPDWQQREAEFLQHSAYHHDC